MRKLNEALRREVLKTIGDLFIRAGFGKLTAVNFSLTINSEAVGLVGLPVITQPGEIGLHVAPSLGLRHEELEKLVCELTGREFDEGTTASLGIVLGYLMPERSYLEFPFSPDIVTEVAEELAAALVEYGVPWMKAHVSLEQILEELLNMRYTYRDAARLRIPACHYLMGEPDRAKSIWNRNFWRSGTPTTSSQISTGVSPAVS